MLQIVLTIDCERFISFKQGNPRWNCYEKLKGKANNFLKNFRHNKRGFEVVYNTIIQEKFPATFMITGKFFKPLKSPDFIEWGWHTQNHLPLTLIKGHKIKEEIKNIYNLKSFTAPMWMIEDLNSENPLKIFKLLKTQRYTHCVYRGTNKGIRHQHYNQVTKPFKKAGIRCIWVSGFIEGNYNKKKINNLKQNILKNLHEDGVYLLTTHDFTHKNNKVLLDIIRFLKKLEKDKKIKIMRLKDVK